MGKLVARVRQLFQEAEACPHSQPAPVCDSQETRDALQVLGLKVGDKVVVGGVKVGTLYHMHF